MASTLVLGLIAIVGYFFSSRIISLRNSIAAAKRTGLPYGIAPWSPYSTFWLVTHKIWIPQLEKLPTSWTKSWLFFMAPDWPWDLLYEPLTKLGDVFLIVSPGDIQIWVSNAEVINQITSKRDAFPKPLESYKLLDIFGRNMVTTEAGEWKKHRKITSPGFNEKNNAMVFAESCSQALGMLRKWLGPSGAGNFTVEEVPSDTMKLTLHIISRIGFGVHLLWPGETPSENESAGAAVYSSDELSAGHAMSFEGALETFLDKIFFVLVLPEWLLKLLPFKKPRLAYKAYSEWRQYMHELFAQKIKEARTGQKSQGMDIMGTLTKNSYGKDENSSSNGTEKGQAGKDPLTDSEVLGNSFVMILAGHETTANTIHFALIGLAINPSSQRLVQKETQAIFGDQPPENWDYDSNINALLGSIIGATMNEQLRLMPPVIAIPKRVTRDQDQDIIIDGKKHTLPAGAKIWLNTVGIHRNPKYWPSQPSKISNSKVDLDDFRPERWLVSGQKVSKVQRSEAEDDFGGFTGNSSHDRLFNPVRGSYIPFSEGPRSCIGRRLAQVEIVALLAVIFQKHSIELAVDEWATDEQVAKMSDDEKRALYRKAQVEARKTLRSAATIITLKLQTGFVPVRVVKKGEERFLHLVD